MHSNLRMMQTHKSTMRKTHSWNQYSFQDTECLYTCMAFLKLLTIQILQSHLKIFNSLPWIFNINLTRIHICISSLHGHWSWSWLVSKLNHVFIIKLTEICIQCTQRVKFLHVTPLKENTNWHEHGFRITDMTSISESLTWPWIL